MRLKHIEISGFKSFAKKSTLSFTAPVTAVVGPNGSGKSNVVEAFRFVLGEQSMKSMRGKSGADLIFRGSSGTAKLSRAAVSITFDNSDKVFAFQGDSSNTPVLFDTITFTRELYADGTSKYLLNGTEIRLKQMVELLSSVHIGGSSHHIISQGEADSVLRASPRDRRGILEEALGLKVYHYRIKESEAKLVKSTETLKEVQSLRRELAPHLSFLKKQVEKIEKGRSLRTELEGLMLSYLSSESAHLHVEDEHLRSAMKLLRDKKNTLENELANLPDTATHTDTTTPELLKEKHTLEEIQNERRSLESRIGRLEGMIEVERRLSTVQSGPITFSEEEYHALLGDIEEVIRTIREAKSMEGVEQGVRRLEPIITRLKDREPKKNVQAPGALHDIALELEDLQKKLTLLIAREAQSKERIAAIEIAREQERAQKEEQHSKRYELRADLTNTNADLSIIESKHSVFLERKALYDSELKEAAFLFGSQFLHTLKETKGMPELDLVDIKRTIDRLKIRLDEHTGIGQEVVGKYESTLQRDAFLSREVADIEGSIRNLETLIIDLKKVLDEKFTGGVTVINERFSEFFKTMFGGGSAFLEVTVEKKKKRKSDEDFDEESYQEEDERFMERGIEVHVNLPEKKVKELTMLSGGERSLVSIALLFAISQVNPPPFLVLDETDAALDEANSRRYGDMIERLSAYSQLIVVTHNRETMSRAQVLYGVTLGADGGSKLLSIKFDEAVKVAK